MGCTPDDGGMENNPSTLEIDPNVNVRQVSATDTTISIAWTVKEENVPYLAEVVPNSAADYTTDITKKYKATLYRDKSCMNIVTSVSPIKENMADGALLFNSNTTPPRFIFSGLTPSTTYYVRVSNLTNSTVNAKAVAVRTTASVADKRAVVTSDAKEGDLILFENFSGIIYGGDLTSHSAGISRTDCASLTSLSGAGATGEIELTDKGYYGVGAGTEIGLFSTLAGLLDDMGIEKWGWIGGKSNATGSSVCARPGYVKIGTTANRSFICTPILSAIPEGKMATVKVVFRAAPYGDQNAIDSERFMAVAALSRAALGSDNKMNYLSQTDRVTLTLEGDYPSDWKEYTVTLRNVPHNGSIAIGGALGETENNRMFVDDIRVYITSLSDSTQSDYVKGTIRYSDGTPAAGVSVSDGFSVVQTDAEGNYKLYPHLDCWYIYYSTPADCEVAINEHGQPAFFTRYDPVKDTYDFTLTKLPGGKESKFSLFCLADPQCKDNRETDNKGRRHGDRFATESVPQIRAHAQTKGAPCYGVTLGDIVYSEGSRNNEAFMDDMRDFMAADKIGMPVFQTMGNHDYTYFHTNQPIEADATSSTYNIKAQRAFETVFGPINYSWNRSDAHIISMRTMQWNTNTSWSNYTLCFTDEQTEWLRQDLAAVPKDKLVIFCVHIPLNNSKNKNIQNVIGMLKQYNEAHIMAGHTHYNRNEPTLSGGVYEHTHGAVCGQWWWSNMNGDGVPNGYGVYDIEGNTIKNWYYMGVNEGMNDRDYQLRLYRGNIKGGKESKSFNMQLGDDVILANVFNADPSWKVEIFEDGVSAGYMTLIPSKKYDASKLGDYPCLIPTDSSQDWWSIGYHIGVVGRGKTNSYSNACYHMYRHTLKNPDATTIRVEATDRFDRTYTCDKITADYEYTLME
ncbi:MAG: calcineurin-like phosphoesterase C-terminal domain-containing protein [Alistipes sp.]|nr:calcineurin-like phosphoesterase C-terminal domain-containing protein [Alistipes sp.]